MTLEERFIQLLSEKIGFDEEATEDDLIAADDLLENLLAPANRP